MLPLLIFDAFYFHDEWGPNELSHTTESETGLIPVKYKCHRNICSMYCVWFNFCTMVTLERNYI